MLPLSGMGPGTSVPHCLGFEAASKGSEQANTVSETSRERPFTVQERERVMRQFHHLHRTTGHGSYESLLKSLENRRADPRVLELARNFRCNTCEERKRPQPRRLANLEVSTDRCKIIQMDAAHWTPSPGDPRNKCQFLVVVDEASRFAVAKIFRKDGGGHVKASDITSTYHTIWEPCFGVPEVVRIDPDGACRSRELDQHFQSLNVELDHIPADAHWKISIVERTIQWIEELMSKCAIDHPEYDHEMILCQAVRTWNQSEPVKGYSPFQWMFGRALDAEGRMFTPDVHRLPGSLLHHPSGSLQHAENLRIVGEKAFIDWQYQTKLSRAKNSRSRNYVMYMPGDLVYFWRLQGQGRKGGKFGLKHGAFAGPARILAMETKIKDNMVAPSSIVWLVRGMRLIKATVEQLRRATEREVLVHELTEGKQDMPWTTTSLAEALGPHDFDDASADGPPSTQDLEMAEESEPELIPAAPPTRRIVSKRAPEEEPTGARGRRGVPPESRAESSSVGPRRLLQKKPPGHREHLRVSLQWKHAASRQR